MTRLILTAAFTACLAGHAVAQVQCAPLIDVLHGLAVNYAETVRTRALTTDGALLMITASDTGGWTAMIVSPDGTACLVAAGEAFELVPPAPLGDPA